MRKEKGETLISYLHNSERERKSYFWLSTISLTYIILKKCIWLWASFLRSVQSLIRSFCWKPPKGPKGEKTKFSFNEKKSFEVHWRELTRRFSPVNQNKNVSSFPNFFFQIMFHLRRDPRRFERSDDTINAWFTLACQMPTAHLIIDILFCDKKSAMWCIDHNFDDSNNRKFNLNSPFCCIRILMTAQMLKYVFYSQLRWFSGWHKIVNCQKCFFVQL